jgi:hypothetical protein
MIYDFTDLTVVSYNITGSYRSGDAKPTISYALIYETVKVEFFK